MGEEDVERLDTYHRSVGSWVNELCAREDLVMC